MVDLCIIQKDVLAFEIDELHFAEKSSSYVRFKFAAQIRGPFVIVNFFIYIESDKPPETEDADDAGQNDKHGGKQNIRGFLCFLHGGSPP